ncbi:hypothetical protein B566_EDAN008881 [Ephemera danica]|nr:hypothetical protein B566_EDAN008881 [Ephemera danica]
MITHKGPNHLIVEGKMKKKVDTSAAVEPPHKRGFFDSLTSLVFTAFFLALAFRHSDFSFPPDAPWYINGNYYQVKWVQLVDAIGGEKMASIHGYVIPRILFYWGMAIPFLIVDFTGKPAFIKKYKVQPGTNEPLAPRKFMEMVSHVLFNQIVVGFFYGYVHYWLMLLRGCPTAYELPSLGRFVLDFLILLPLFEIGLYYSHRILHHRWFYKRFHKLHHENTAVVCIDNHRVHWFEHIFSTLLPHSLAAIVVGTHTFTYWFYIGVININTIWSHCGYHLPFLPSPELHDYHHLKYHEAFGGFGWLDRIHGTDDSFRKTVHYKRHRVLLSLKSARELWPDVDEKKK